MCIPLKTCRLTYLLLYICMCLCTYIMFIICICVMCWCTSLWTLIKRWIILLYLLSSGVWQREEAAHPRMQFSVWGTRRWYLLWSSTAIQLDYRSFWQPQPQSQLHQALHWRVALCQWHCKMRLQYSTLSSRIKSNQYAINHEQTSRPRCLVLFFLFW